MILSISIKRIIPGRATRIYRQQIRFKDISSYAANVMTKRGQQQANNRTREGPREESSNCKTTTSLNIQILFHSVSLSNFILTQLLSPVPYRTCGLTSAFSTELSTKKQDILNLLEERG